MSDAKRIERATAAGRANEAFIAAQQKLDEVMAELVTLRENCFGQGDRQRNFSDVCEAVDFVNRLVGAANRVNGHEEFNLC